MNPFSYGTIVRDIQFYDRTDECKRIVDTLSGGNNLVLYAPRRFGKTSLVFKAIEKLEKEGFVCIYFDFMPVFSTESFVRLYSKALSAKQTNHEKFIRTFISLIKNIRPVLNFGPDGMPELSIDFAGSEVNETVIGQMLDIPENMAGADKRIIVFFDEFQEVERLDSIRFESLLRSKIQQQRRVNYMFLGSKTHIIKELFNDKKRAFYNAASQMSIGYLPEEDTIAYLQRSFSGSSIEIEPSIAKYIISITANIPHYIQLLSAEIWQYMINTYTTVTKEIVELCVLRVIALKNDYYMELFNNQSQSKKQLLLALTVNGKNIFSASYIKQHRLPSAATLQRAANGLVTEGTVEKMNDEYFITDPFFRLFLKGI